MVGIHTPIELEFSLQSGHLIEEIFTSFLGSF